MKRSVRERVDRDLHVLTGLEPAHVGLVHQRARSHLREVGHLHQRRPAAHRIQRRGDDRSQRHVLGDDRPVDRGAHRGVLEALLGQVERRARAHHLRLRLRHLQLGRLVLGPRDHLARVQIVGALPLRLGHREACLGRPRVRRRLIEAVLHVARVDLHDQVADVHDGPDLDRHLDDLPRGARLDVHDVDRLHRAGGRRVHDDVTPLDRLGGHRHRLRSRAAASRGERERDARARPPVRPVHRSRPTSCSSWALALR